MSKKILTAAGVVLAAVVIFVLFQVFREVPASESVLEELRTVGLLYYRQQDGAVEGVKEGLRELGYENITYIDKRHSPGPDDQKFMREAIKEFVEKDVDLIFAGLEFQAKTAIEVTKEMNSDIPIVFLTSFHDPIKYGLAESFRSSGNNSTGVALDIVTVIQKQLEFTKKIKPDAKNIGIFTDGFMIPFVSNEVLAELRVQAEHVGFNLVEYTTKAPPPGAEKAWHETAGKIRPGDVDVFYHLAGHFYEPQQDEEEKLAERIGVLYAMLASGDWETAGHFFYGGGFKDSALQSTVLMDKIFRGARPSDIPLEFSRKLSLFLHLTRAKGAGVEFPESVLLLADVIDK